MRRLDHINIIQLKYFFFSSEEKVSDIPVFDHVVTMATNNKHNYHIMWYLENVKFKFMIVFL